MQELKKYTRLRKGRGKSQPLYQQIRHQLSEQIKSGRLSPGERLPSVSQMVKAWDVDYKTVNIALERMQKDGLIRRELGRGKGPVVTAETRCTYSVTFLRWSNDGFPLEITEGVRKFAEEKKLKFSITDVSRSQKNFFNTLSHPVEGIDGIIVVPLDSPEFRKACMSARELGVKIIFVDRNLEGLPISAVSIDHVGSAHQATRHLLDTHGLPVYCMGLTSISSVQARLQGWSSAMHEYGFHEQKPYIYETAFVDTRLENFLQIDKHNNYEAALKLLKKRNGNKISIFSCTGCAAQGVYEAANELGLKIGTDVYVAGFGDSPACWRLPVPLTSVPQKWQELGYEAANLLLMEMTGALQHPIYRLLPAKLRIRASSAGPATDKSNVYD